MTWSWLDDMLWFIVAMVAIAQLFGIGQSLDALTRQVRHLTESERGRGSPPDPD